jgi:2-iminobutanoate/2-iminopropanoate deaminase
MKHIAPLVALAFLAAGPTVAQTPKATKRDLPKKDTRSLGMPWETEYGYAQGLKQDGTVWLSGQVGHDEHGTVAGDMETQMRQAYANIRKLLAGFGLTMNDVVDETLYVRDNATAYAARQKLGREVYPDPMQVPSTMIGVTALNLPALLVEIKVVARQPTTRELPR